MDSIGPIIASMARPAPGSYPVSEKVDQPPSVASTSVQVKDEINSILKDANFMPVTYKGDSCWVVPKARWEEAEKRLADVVARDSTTVPTAELAELQRELSMLRLKLNNFESENERYQFAESRLKDALSLAKQNEEKAKIDAQKALTELSTATTALKSSLASAAMMKKDYETALRNAKQSGTPEDVSKLQEDKKRLSDEITHLNNSLQQVNSDKKAVNDRLKRFERQSLELTNELNVERSRHAIANPAPGQTFAEKAKAVGSGSVNMVNAAYTNLSSVARTRFNKIADNPTEDEKNTIFWLKATFDASKHAVYQPYKRIFGGLGDDIKHMSNKSRKLFDPFLIAVRDSLLPSGRPLTFEEMTLMLGSFDSAEIELNSIFKRKGYKTLADLNDAGFSLSDDPANLPNKGSKGKNKVEVSLDDNLLPPLKHIEPKPDETLSIAPSDDSSNSSDGELSYWLRVRMWFNSVFDTLNDRVKRALSSNPNRLKRYFRLSTGNIFQRFLLVPYSWYLWAFP
ncbi:MAG: 59 kDa protein [Fusariviridae sp.]|nr:MAG: 59 kDa protein [Fusariviridae sp.]WAK72341.1 MAG: 59 kDa protein [Fusariviridae sp.]